jgi:GT2 family glycosyltransferase
MDISVVIPTYNRREIVRRSLETLFSQTIAPSRFEIIAVVDGSTDGTGDCLRGLHPACRFRVIEQENRGLSGARNTGYRAAETDLVLFLDDDMRCEPGLVAAHLAAHRGSGQKVAFGAVLLSADSPHTLPAECFNREIGAFHLEFRRNPKTKWRITDCVFQNASFPRALLEQVGGFDESFHMREDLELGIRIFSAGAEPVYAGDAVAYQYYEKSAARLIDDAKAFAEADVQFARKHPEAVIEGQLVWLARQPCGKRFIHRLAASMPFLADLILAPVCALGEVFISVQYIRKIAVYALQLRRRVYWYRRVVELGWRPSEARFEGAKSSKTG